MKFYFFFFFFFFFQKFKFEERCFFYSSPPDRPFSFCLNIFFWRTVLFRVLINARSFKKEAFGRKKKKKNGIQTRRNRKEVHGNEGGRFASKGEKKKDFFLFSCFFKNLNLQLRGLGMSTDGRKAVLVQRLALMETARMRSESPFVREEALESTPPISAALPTPSDWSPTLAKPVSVTAAPSQPPQEFFFSPPIAPASSPKRALFPDACDAAANDNDLSRRQSCMSTPRSDSKKPRVSFGSVEMRKYRVSHGGSLSTPSHGAYPIGLSWEVKEEVKVPLSEFEKDVNAPTNASPRRLDERQRKLLLEKVDRRSLFEKQASWETEREELSQLRRSRQMVGCGCAGTAACGTSKCLCFKNQVACNDDSCGCTCDTCLNPQRYNFDPEKVSSYRRAKMQEAPYTGKDENEKVVDPMILL